ncbi:hypothetical protein [Actinopolymorpha alba]|uniref:hypothetical protein n=1 Tax=Actinopolymorpha alba TaxID=533267 RepID=UPI00037E6637|nr:hypothetical protein [Actinopolymorpha alba]
MNPDLKDGDLSGEDLSRMFRAAADDSGRPFQIDDLDLLARGRRRVRWRRRTISAVAAACGVGLVAAAVYVVPWNSPSESTTVAAKAPLDNPGIVRECARMAEVRPPDVVPEPQTVWMAFHHGRRLRSPVSAEPDTIRPMRVRTTVTDQSGVTALLWDPRSKAHVVCNLDLLTRENAATMLSTLDTSPSSVRQSELAEYTTVDYARSRPCRGDARDGCAWELWFGHGVVPAEVTRVTFAAAGETQEVPIVDGRWVLRRFEDPAKQGDQPQPSYTIRMYDARGRLVLDDNPNNR